MDENFHNVIFFKFSFIGKTLIIIFDALNDIISLTKRFDYNINIISERFNCIGIFIK